MKLKSVGDGSQNPDGGVIDSSYGVGASQA
jgi:hypothetical protein